MKRAANETPTKLMNWTRGLDDTPTKQAPSIPLCITRSSPTKCIKQRNPAISRVNTFVFFDTETSGLINDNRLIDDWDRLLVKGPEKFTDNLDKIILQTNDKELPRLTEISFVAIPRDTFREYQAVFKKDESDGVKELGRYIPTNTHTRQINPNLTLGEWIQYDASKAKCDKIVHQQKVLKCKNTFDREWPAVIDFFNSLEKPVAIVAHNGMRFDFRVLFGEIKRYKLLEEYPIPKEVLFVDSMALIKQVEIKFSEDMQLHCKNVDWAKIAQLCRSQNKVIPDQIDLPQEPQQPQAKDDSSFSMAAHPFDFLNFNEWSIAKKRRILKTYFKRGTDNTWTYDSKGARFARINVGMLFEQLVGGKFTAHYAQQDSEALMQICMTYGEEFLNFVDQNAAEFPF